MPLTASTVTFIRAARQLARRLVALEAQLDAGEISAWPDYLATLDLALKVDAQLQPGAHGELLSTKDFAARLGVTPKTVIRRKTKGSLTPAMQAGRLIRWKGSEAVQ